MRLLRAAILGAATLAFGHSAIAFGTARGLGQNAEHERITRHALGCDVAGGLDSSICFQPYSLAQIAGKADTWGGVGAPDNPARRLMSTIAAHCDNGDYMDTPDYPHSKEDARANLTTCRNWMDEHLNDAVLDAAAILKDGRIDDSEIPTRVSCTFTGKNGRAKCNVIEELGLALHAAQDFYAHSNWADTSGPQPISITNVPGLGHSEPAPWIDLRRTDLPFPDGLITGCFLQLKTTDIKGTSGCAGRATHYYLNKDEGQIDPQPGRGTTIRGLVDDNFTRAVDAAISDTRDKWATLRERIIARYGTTAGTLIICAITHADPARTCGTPTN